MTWVSIDDRLPPLERRVPVAGDHIPMDEQGRPLYGPFPHAARRQYSDIPWHWSSGEWRATVGIRYWWDST